MSDAEDSLDDFVANDSEDDDYGSEGEVGGEDTPVKKPKKPTAPKKKADGAPKPKTVKPKAAPKKKAAREDEEDNDVESDNFDFDASSKKKKKPAAAAAVAPAPAAPKKKPKKKASSDDEMADGGEEGDEDASPSKKRARAGPVVDYDTRTIEQIYQKKTHLEQILLRPDTYIGAVQEQETSMWVWDEGKGMQFRSVKFVPGLYKIFDEILVNAADNKQRDPLGMNCIRVTIDSVQNSISVYNNGQGIPVVIHKEHGVYVPELIFGHLLTSSNYDDNVKKVVGGRNGYGAKLANIFSTEFLVETYDAERHKQYEQRFSRNMTQKSEPKIIDKPAVTREQEKGWTRLTFRPDLPKFGMQSFNTDTVALITKRVYDVAGCNTTVKVYLNNKLLPIRSWKAYVELYIKPQQATSSSAAAAAAAGSSSTAPILAAFGLSNSNTAANNANGTATTLSNSASSIPPSGDGVPLTTTKEPTLLTLEPDPRWDICVAVSETGFQQVSFVNSICTMKGGTHINYIVDKIVDHLKPVLTKKNKNTAVKPFMIKNHLWVFCRALVENPAFDSQTKENLTSKSSTFGSLPKFDEKFLKKLAKSEIVEQVLHYAAYKQGLALKKQSGSKRERVSGITKLVDAADAGGRNADKCTLILTEGDSAKSTAIAGCSVVGMSRYGVFPLRGKLLNVRDVAHKRLMANEEITNLVKILGLRHGVKYTDTKSLRYGHLMIMTDQDTDGSHIKGLVLNLLHTFWPELLRLPGFVLQFITPIVKATRGQQREVFFSIPDYVRWKEARSGAKGWQVRYYKGLGTSTREEAIQYFSDLPRHCITFTYSGSPCDQAIDLGFNKKKAGERKTWLTNYSPDNTFNYNVKKMSFSEFVHKEFILYSLADCQRSIPCLVDGLKPSQRKVLYGALKRRLTHDMKVQQLSGYVSGETAYHHGDVSLQATIVAMAQSFVGKNNINLLFPSGAFGTRLVGGKDAASARYIFTRLCKITRFIFHPDDDDILSYLDDDGQPIEPQWFCPVLPMILVNGSEGIGVGWSTSVPCFNPRDLVDNLLRLLHSEEIQPLAPWYRGFKGSIEPEPNGKSYRIVGKWQQVDEQTIRVTELPIGTWTHKYKKFLEENLIGNEKSADGAKKKKKTTTTATKKKADDADENNNNNDDDEDAADKGGKKKKPAASSKNQPFVQNYKVRGDDLEVDFEVQIPAAMLAEMIAKGTLESRLKLSATVNKSNMHLFDQTGRIRHYDTAEDVLKEFFQVRLSMYEKRKQHKIDVLREEDERLANKVRFVKMVVEGELVVHKRKRAELLRQLHALKFKSIPRKPKASTPATAVPQAEEDQRSEMDSDDDDDDDGEDEEERENDDEDEEEEEKKSKPKSQKSGGGTAKDFEYLLGMPLWSLTHEKIAKLQAEKDRKAAELAEVLRTAPTTFYERDLGRFVTALDEWEDTEYRRMHAQGARKKALTKRKKQAAEEDEYEAGPAAEDFGSSKRRPPPMKKPAAVDAAKRVVPADETKPKEEEKKAAAAAKEEKKPSKEEKKAVVKDEKKAAQQQQQQQSTLLSFVKTTTTTAAAAAGAPTKKENIRPTNNTAAVQVGAALVSAPVATNDEESLTALLSKKTSVLGNSAAAATAAAAKNPRVKQQTKQSDDGSDEGEEFVPLAQRLAARGSTPPSAAPLSGLVSAAIPPPFGLSRPTTIATTTAAPASTASTGEASKKRAAEQPPPVEVIDLAADEDEDEEAGRKGTKPAAKKSKAPAKKAAPKPKKKKTAPDSDEEEEEEEEEEDSEDEKPSAGKSRKPTAMQVETSGRRPARVAAQQKPKYVDEEDEEEDVVADDDSDDSDVAPVDLTKEEDDDAFNGTGEEDDDE